MPKRMLIDASHPEETRVVVLDGQKVEEFDFEAASKRPLKGNIYLAKVTRVEPSLQAAFVEYGGNRQGFLAFSEIHPDYYQIPVADRLALLAEQEAEARRRSDDDVESFDITPGPKIGAQSEFDEIEVEEAGDDRQPTESAVDESATLDLPKDNFEAQTVLNEKPDEPIYEDHSFHEETSYPRDDEGHDEFEELLPDKQASAENTADVFSSEMPHIQQTDALHQNDEVSPMGDQASEQTARPLQAQRPPQRWMRKRHYKIQEVIKRRQIILVQVVKEERGNKGAALTTYLSLAGRYCVLMPNTPRGGGISRKITNANDRKRLKSAAQALELPEGMGLIIRTAGENRTKVEIKRDYEYLLRMWDTIRELTLKSNAPACVYEEGDLVKRAIRDLYNKDVGEILVEGDEGYRNAKEFMRMLMPSHAKNVKPYKEATPLFHRHHIEAQLDAMFSPTVTLKSGGYIVINQTEALVSIDVNSGRATREHSIEETARKTNLEAADEIGRQLRLRDLAGLIVIDFIDMEDSRNDRDVERRIREAVKNDRARVQIGKISQFGLLEMSRQRLRAGVIAGSTVPCPHCGGQGIVRSVESTALRLLRGLEEEGQKLKASAVVVRVAADVAIYTLNQKRRELARIEGDYGMVIAFEPKEGLMAGTFEIERTVQKTPEERAQFAAAVEIGAAAPAEEDEADIVVEADEETVEESEVAPEQQSGPQPQPGNSSSKRRRRRRGGRGRGGDHAPSPHGQQTQHPLTVPAPPPQPAVRADQGNGDPASITTDAQASSEAAIPQSLSGQPGAPRKRRRRRGRRGGSSQPSGGQQTGSLQAPQSNGHDRFGASNESDTTPREERVHQAQTSHREIATPNASSTPVWSLTAERGETASGVQETVEKNGPAPESKPALDPAAEMPRESAPAQPRQPAKKGWWQRTFRSEG